MRPKQTVQLFLTQKSKILKGVQDGSCCVEQKQNCVIFLSNKLQHKAWNILGLVLKNLTWDSKGSDNFVYLSTRPDLGQGRRQKIFQGGGGNGKKDRKISKKYLKIALFSLFQGGGKRKKDRKIAKQGRKIALLSFYILYLYHIKKCGGAPPPLPPAADAHDLGRCLM